MNRPLHPLLTMTLASLLLCAGVQAAGPQTLPPAEVPPPPGLDDPGVSTPAPATDARKAAPPAGAEAPASADNPFAPLPPPDARLVRDKASRDAAETRARMAASEVTTRSQGNDRIEEYRQNGQLWMVKIHPQGGPTQTFYTDMPGGRLMRNPNEGPISPVYYTLYEWK